VTDTEKYRRLLLQEKERLEESIKGFARRGLERSLRDSIMEFSTIDNHPADVGTETFEREKDFGLREDQRTTLDMVESALGRLEEGRYGICDRCGHPIADERLETVPWTANCLRCEEALEKEESRIWDRPAEEDVRPAFSSFTDNDPDDPVVFDGEDAWQAVARYGTSNTPGDFPGATSYEETYIDADENIGVVEEVEWVDDSSFDPGQAGEEGTLAYEDGLIVSSENGRSARPATGGDTRNGPERGEDDTGERRGPRGRRRRKGR
jgi:YteA family regulatory protein